jgi:hypothetical protein
MHQEISKPVFSLYIALLKAMQSWFHSAHHVTRGVGFAGDHVLIYGEIYSSIGGTLDGAIEKGIGITECEDVADPVAILTAACDVLGGWRQPHMLSADEIAKQALAIEIDYLDTVEEIFTTLEEAGCLSLGFNDFLAATSNEHEGFVYKLRQRSK